MENNKRRSVLGLVFLTVFLDLVGFSIIFPLFPHMLEHYVALEGPESLIGQLEASLRSAAGGDSAPEYAVVVLFGGLLGSVYSLLQFLFAPFWGALSDRYGRRPVLLVTLGGTALSYALWFVSGRFLVLVAARFLGGIMAGNISIASAVIADTHEGPERAKGMGIIGMAIGLGFVLGPALGGVASLWMLGDGDPSGAAFALHPFSAAAAVAFVLALINWLWALRKFPETRPERGARAAEGRTLRPFHALRPLGAAGVRATCTISFLYLVAFSAMEFTLTFLVRERFDWQPKDIAWMFVFIGFVIAFVQGGLVRRLVPRFGERKLTMAGIGMLVPGFALVAWAGSGGVLYLGLGLTAFGSALAMPSLSSLASRYSPADVQGLVLGAFRSVGALARAIGPVLGGALYFLFGARMPYLAGAALLLVPALLAGGLPPVPDSEPAAGEAGEPAA